MVGTSRRGFTLIEAIVALTISSLIVVMVSTVFLVQNQYYAIQLSRSTAHDNARTMTELMASELRSVMQGGVVTAKSDSLVVRTPIVLAAVCAQVTGHKVSVQYRGGYSGLASSEVAGIALLNSTTGVWTYNDASFSAFYQAGATPAVDCVANGADTVGGSAQYEQFKKLNTYFSGDPANGSILMLYRKVGYSIRTSSMDPSLLGLYRTVSGGTPVEVATGIDSSAKFQYRTGGSSYANSVSTGSLANIDAIRIVAEARTRPKTGGVDDITYGWSVNLVLRNGN